MVVKTKPAEKNWKTKPLETWMKAKEHRKTGYDLAVGAREKKQITCLGMGMRGFSDVMHDVGRETYAADVAHAGLETEFIQAAIDKGYGRDLCSYLQCHLGSMFLNKWAFGGEYPKIDFATAGHTCDHHAKWSLIAAEHQQVPFNATENAGWTEYDSEQSKKNKIDYCVAQHLDQIEWLEKQTGLKFDAEGYIESVYKDARKRNLWGQISLLNQNIPAPLDAKLMYSYMMIAGRNALEIFQMLRDEVEDRVRNQIAAVATERYRLWDRGIPPWYALNYYRYLEQYGAVSVGSAYICERGGGLMLDAAGRLIPRPTLEERGIFLKTLEDALRISAEDGHLNYNTFQTFRYTGQNGVDLELRGVRQWHCNAYMERINPGCFQFSSGLPQVVLGMKENNIPVLTLWTDQTNSKEWDEAREFGKIDAFFRSQGLGKVED